MSPYPPIGTGTAPILDNLRDYSTKRARKPEIVRIASAEVSANAAKLEAAAGTAEPERDPNHRDLNTPPPSRLFPRHFSRYGRGL
ncbi:hypothetical protein ANO14919_127810 [Xylariales sp. No.14919]|nr:hypothetical protein ANO14919_127810 [Xylariales sp. No.14919]